MEMIKLLTRKEYALAHEMTEQGVVWAVNNGNLSKVKFEYSGKDGKKYKGVFILPEEYIIVSRVELKKLSKGITG